MIDTRFQVDHKAFEKQLFDEQRNFERLVTDALWTTAAEAVQFASRTTLFRDRTGELRHKLGWRPRGFFEAQLFATAKHASWVHDGTAAHDIVAAPGKTLAFMQNGRMVFRHRVHHPGTKPRPFLQRSADISQFPLVRRIETAASRAFG